MQLAKPIFLESRRRRKRKDFEFGGYIFLLQNAIWLACFVVLYWLISSLE